MLKKKPTIQSEKYKNVCWEVYFIHSFFELYLKSQDVLKNVYKKHLNI